MKLTQSINSACCFDTWYLVHTLIKVTGKIKLVHEIDACVCDHLKHSKRLLVRNRESPELSLYAFNSMSRTTLEVP